MNKNKMIPIIGLLPLLLIAFILFRIVWYFNVSWLLGVLSPIIWAVAIAYLLNPMVKMIEKYSKIKRAWSILISYIIVLGIVTFVITIVTPNIINSIGNFISNASEYLKDAQEFFKSNMQKFELLDEYGITSYIEKNFNDLLEKSNEIIKTVLDTVLTQAINVTFSVINVIIGLLISIYLLADKENLFLQIKRIIYAFFNKSRAEGLTNLFKEIDSVFSKYLIGKLIDSLIIGVLCFVILTIVNMPYGLLISVIVGITNMIPYFGPIFGGIPGVIIVLFISPIKALWLFIIILALQQFDGWILGPKILGGQVGLKPLWIIVAITLGGAMFGVLGMFLGVPVVAVLKLLIERATNRRLKEKGIEKFN